MNQRFWVQNKLYILGFVIVILFLAIAAGVVLQEKPTGSQLLKDYETCAAQPQSRIQESYPSVCVDAAGNRFENPKERAIMEAREHAPTGVCGQALTEARHIATGATYTFGSTCLAPGWEAL